jgi:hypothetical protein
MGANKSALTVSGCKEKGVFIQLLMLIQQTSLMLMQFFGKAVANGAIALL